MTIKKAINEGSAKIKKGDYIVVFFDTVIITGDKATAAALEAFLHNRLNSRILE